MWLALMDDFCLLFCVVFIFIVYMFIFLFYLFVHVNCSLVLKSLMSFRSLKQ